MKERIIEVHLAGQKIGEYATLARTWAIVVDWFFSNISLLPANCNEWPDVKENRDDDRR